MSSKRLLGLQYYTFRLLNNGWAKTQETIFEDLKHCQTCSDKCLCRQREIFKDHKITCLNGGKVQRNRRHQQAGQFWVPGRLGHGRRFSWAARGRRWAAAAGRRQVLGELAQLKTTQLIKFQSQITQTAPSARILAIR